jgi:hypothetical protein
MLEDGNVERIDALDIAALQHSAFRGGGDR